MLCVSIKLFHLFCVSKNPKLCRALFTPALCYLVYDSMCSVLQDTCLWWSVTICAPGFLLVMVCDYMCSWIPVCDENLKRAYYSILFIEFGSPIKWALEIKTLQFHVLHSPWCSYINLVCFNILWLVVDWIAKTLLIHCCDIYFCGQHI